MKGSRSCEMVSVVATVSVASDSAGDTPAATELNGAFKTLDKVFMLIRAAVLLRLHSKKGSAVSHGALMLGVKVYASVVIVRTPQTRPRGYMA
jgi:hypothetical protein